MFTMTTKTESSRYFDSKAYINTFLRESIHILDYKCYKNPGDKYRIIKTSIL